MGWTACLPPLEFLKTEKTAKIETFDFVDHASGLQEDVSEVCCNVIKDYIREGRWSLDIVYLYRTMACGSSWLSKLSFALYVSLGIWEFLNAGMERWFPNTCLNRRKRKLRITWTALKWEKLQRKRYIDHICERAKKADWNWLNMGVSNLHIWCE